MNPVGMGSMCPQCGNGVDDDMDGLTDYQSPGAPMLSDPGCLDRADNDETDECVPAPGMPSAPFTDITVTGTANGTTTGGMNLFTPGCLPASTAPEKVFLYRLASNKTS